jgi:hypothetical protein
MLWDARRRLSRRGLQGQGLEIFLSRVEAFMTSHIKVTLLNEPTRIGVSAGAAGVDEREASKEGPRG